MASYELLIKRSVSKDLRQIPKVEVKRILQRIRALADDPRPPGVEKLSDRERYRMRQGIYRIVYEIDDGVLTVLVVKVGHRRDVYRS